jgi:hypothetical protein
MQRSIEEEAADVRIRLCVVRRIQELHKPLGVPQALLRK